MHDSADLHALPSSQASHAAFEQTVAQESTGVNKSIKGCYRYCAKQQSHKSVGDT